jgi:predicted DNA-binding transcriptional regulator AlpA
MRRQSTVTVIDPNRVPSAGDRLWTPDDTSAFLGIPVGTLYQWRTRSQGPRAYRVGRHLRYDPTDVRQWLDGMAA